METMSLMMELILTHTCGGAAGDALHALVSVQHPQFTDGEFYSALLRLQNGRHLVAESDEGSWVYTHVATGDYIEPEYSPAFAETIIAAECGEWTELDADSFIAELEEMSKKANERRKYQPK